MEIRKKYIRREIRTAWVMCKDVTFILPPINKRVLLS
jgi:hypothetical protein